MVADRGGALVGCITGYRPPRRREALFIWQVAVAEAVRGEGLGVRMLHALASREELEGVSVVEATVAPSNERSRRMFVEFAGQVGAGVKERTCFPRAFFPEGAHEEERLLEIGPIDRTRLRRVST